MQNGLDFISAIALIGDSFPGTIVITDTDFEGDGPHIIYANDKFKNMTGYEPDEAIGQNPKFLQGERTNKFHLKKFIRTLSDGQHARTSIINYRKDGERYICDIAAWPIKDENNTIRYFLALEREVGTGRGRISHTYHDEKWWEALKV